MKQRKMLFREKFLGAIMIMAAMFLFLQSGRMAEAAAYKYGDFAVTELSDSSVSIDYRNLYYETVAGGASVLGYQIYLQDYTAATDAQLVAAASVQQVYGNITGLLPGHEYSVQIHLEYQYPGTSSSEIYYSVQFTTPLSGLSSDIDVVTDTSQPGGGAGTGTTPSASSGSAGSSGSTGSTGIVNTPSVSSVKMVGANVGVVLNRVVCDGYEYAIYKQKSGALAKLESTISSSTSFYGLSRKSVYYVRARAYIYDSNGNKVYSQWSGKEYFVPQPKLSKKGSKLKRNQIKLKWAKVSGASNYTIYIRKRGGGKWTKVKTVSGKKSSYTIKKYKGKSINIRNNSYEVTVKANSKIGGRKYSSNKKDYIYTYTRYRY